VGQQSDQRSIKEVAEIVDEEVQSQDEKFESEQITIVSKLSRSDAAVEESKNECD